MKSSERVIWIILTSLCAAFAFMGHTGMRERKNTPDSVQPSSRGERTSQVGDLTPRPNRQGDIRSIPKGGPELQAYTEAILRHPDPIYRVRSFIRILDQVTPESHADVFAAWRKLRVSGTYLAIEEKMMNHRAGEIMGRDILESRTGSDRDLSMIHALRDQFAGWVSADSIAAAAWLSTLEDGTYKNAMNATYLRTLAINEPGKALAAGLGADPDTQRSVGHSLASAIRDMRSMKAASDYLLAQAKQVDESNECLYQAYLSNIVQGGMEWDRNTTAEVLEDHLNKPYASESLFLEAARKRGCLDQDPSALLAWTQRIVENSNQKFDFATMLTAALSQMDGPKLELVNAWLQNNQNPAMNETLEEILKARLNALSNPE